jgi:hypothetical protein
MQTAAESRSTKSPGLYRYLGNGTGDPNMGNRITQRLDI